MNFFDLRGAKKALQAISANSEAGTKFRVSFANPKASILHSQNVLKIPSWLPSGDYTVEVFQVNEEEESLRSSFEFKLPNKSIQSIEPLPETQSVPQNPFSDSKEGNIPVSALNALLSLRKEDQKEIEDKREQDRIIWEAKIQTLIDNHKNEIERLKESQKNEIERLTSTHKLELALTQGNVSKLEELKDSLARKIETRIRNEQKMLSGTNAQSFDVNTITSLLSHPLASVFISKFFGVELPSVPALAGNPDAMKSMISELMSVFNSGGDGTDKLNELLSRGET
ncbi:hypothetical protein [Leptospira stimsonii]|uniref:DUF4140 domain-containing protein n=1 Tax=Leptospira stimsonii TaxID=2202203 RepID=A0ABY2MV22_9LEPT|nr:hypothetical protein [Leptospira stimsonii]TGK25392.1 hypothetical protein EHO98_03055 [Leptospira stimsonii]TGM08811.1 hypothetical protein EHQ90_22240 [Leptospira stimsonii]